MMEKEKLLQQSRPDAAATKVMAEAAMAMVKQIRIKFNTVRMI
jgi:hypothetical protein